MSEGRVGADRNVLSMVASGLRYYEVWVAVSVGAGLSKHSARFHQRCFLVRYYWDIGAFWHICHWAVGMYYNRHTIMCNQNPVGPKHSSRTMKQIPLACNR